MWVIKHFLLYYLVQFLYGIRILYIRNLSLSENIIQQISTEQPLWAQYYSICRGSSVTERDELPAFAGTYTQLKMDLNPNLQQDGFPRLCAVDLCNLLTVWFWENYWTSLRLHVFICKIKIIVPASEVAEKFRDYGQLSWMCTNSYGGLELAAFTHFPLGDGSRESFLEGIALVWALKDKFLFLKSYLSHQLEGTWLISVWQILYNELTSSLEFFPKLVSLSLSSGADHRLVHCPFWVSIFSSVTQILAAILGSWTFPVDQRWSWKML